MLLVLWLMLMLMLQRMTLGYSTPAAGTPPVPHSHAQCGLTWSLPTYSS